jgi:hypothetical protein
MILRVQPHSGRNVDYASVIEPVALSCDQTMRALLLKCFEDSIETSIFQRITEGFDFFASRYFVYMLLRIINSFLIWIYIV